MGGWEGMQQLLPRAAPSRAPAPASRLASGPGPCRVALRAHHPALQATYTLAGLRRGDMGRQAAPVASGCMAVSAGNQPPHTMLPPLAYNA